MNQKSILLGTLIVSNALIIFLVSINGRLFESVFFNLINPEDMHIFMGFSFILGFSSLWFILKGEAKNFKSFFYASLICFLVMYVSQSFIGKPVEKVHLILFSFFGLFCAYYYDIRKAIVISLSMSLADEILQFFLPDRYFGWGDVIVNSFASVMTVLIFQLTKKDK